MYYSNITTLKLKPNLYKMEKKILLALEKIFSKVFEKKIKLNKNVSSSNIEGWDSLANLNILMAIEKEFDIQFNLSEIENLKNIGGMMELMKIKINEKTRNRR